MSTLGQDWYHFISRKTWKSDGVNDARLLSHHSIAKWNSDTSPYLIPNEWVSARIANCLGLPCPPFALSRKGAKGRRYFASLRYGRSGEALPPDTDPTALFQRHPRICTGILLFDILIANADRHTGNLPVDSPAEPKRLWIIDHEHALCGAMKGGAKKRLQDLLDRLGVSGGSVTSENRHCLLDVVDTAEYVPEWIDRIGTIPEWFMKDTCFSGKVLGIDKKTAELVFQFLQHRKLEMGKLIHDNKAEFTKIKDWQLFP